MCWKLLKVIVLLLVSGTANVVKVRLGGDLRRVPYEPYVAELRRWQRELNWVTELDDDPLSDPVNLADIQEAAPHSQTIRSKLALRQIPV